MTDCPPASRVLPRRDVGSGGQLPTTCDATLGPDTKCASPAVVLFHLGNFVIVARCSMHAEACRTALRRFLTASSWSEEQVVTDEDSAAT